MVARRGLADRGREECDESVKAVGAACYGSDENGGDQPEGSVYLTSTSRNVKESIRGAWGCPRGQAVTLSSGWRRHVYPFRLRWAPRSRVEVGSRCQVSLAGLEPGGGAVRWVKKPWLQR